MIGTNDIGYITDLCKPYADSLKRVKDFKSLCSHVGKWKLLASDAYDAAHSPQFSWEEYEEGCKKERKDVYAGDEWAAKYGAIMMPELLMRIAIIAQQYKVPDGCVFIRLHNLGQIMISNGRAQLVKEKAE